MTEKQCTKCGEVKPVSAFGKHKRAKDGLQSRCRICRKQYRQEHKDEEAAGRAQYLFLLRMVILMRAGEINSANLPDKIDAAFPCARGSDRRGRG